MPWEAPGPEATLEEALEGRPQAGDPLVPLLTHPLAHPSGPVFSFVKRKVCPGEATSMWGWGQGTVFAGDDATVGHRGEGVGFVGALPEPSPHKPGASWGGSCSHGWEEASAPGGPQGGAGVPIHEQYNQSGVKC